MSNWNVKQLTSRDRIKSILITRDLGQPTVCTFQLERVIVDSSDIQISSSGLAPLTLQFETAVTDATLAPFIQQVSNGLEGLAQAAYIAANPDAIITPDN